MVGGTDGYMYLEYLSRTYLPMRAYRDVLSYRLAAFNCSSSVRILLRHEIAIAIAIAARLGELPYWVRGIMAQKKGKRQFNSA